MKMIVGLGNPGKEYENTRHNVGFMVLDSFVTDFKIEKKFQAMIKKEKIQTEDVLYVKPLTYMNLSGIAVSKIANYYHIAVEDILVIQDDLDLPFGKYRLKVHNSSGGHNGIKSIISSLNTDQFARLKIGISSSSEVSVVDYVLGKFSKKDLEFFQEHFSTYREIIENFVLEGISKTMNKFN